MANFKQITRSLAGAFVLGSMDEETLVAHAAGLFFRDCQCPKWLPQVARHIEQAFSKTAIRPTRDEVIDVLLRCPALLRARDKKQLSLGSTRIHVAAKMCPAIACTVPSVVNLAELAKVLELDLDDLGWLTTCKNRVSHYHLRWHDKRCTPRARLIETPKPLLKQTEMVSAKTPNCFGSCCFYLLLQFFWRETMSECFCVCFCG